MAGSVWTGHLAFGLVSIPVRLVPGARPNQIGFHMLHRSDNVRLKQQLVCPEDNQVVDRKDVVKGYEYEKGQYVVIEPEEIKKIQPKTAKEMEILEFVKASEVDPVYFESSYYLVPEEGGRHAYSLLLRALADSEYVGIAKVSMHNREYTVILRPQQNGIMLHTIYSADEVRQVEGLGNQKTEPKAGELKVAHQLIEALAAEWNPEKYHDSFQENVKKLIEAKLEGEELPTVEKPKKPAKQIDLLSALRESLAEAPGRKKPPHRAEAPHRTAAKSTKKSRAA